jgi:hypothetical protein
MSNDITRLTKVANSAFSALGVRADLKGKGYISLLRCSGISQADTSPDGQKEVNDAYSAMQQMRWAGYDVYAEGVSGSQTFNREDIQEILHLKRTRNDFDAVVVFELGRATRGGIRHGNVLEDELRKAGIELISSTELIPDGPLGDLIKAVKHFSNQQQAYNISKSVARGLAQSLAKSSRPSAGRTNFGLDRLYVGPDGTERTLIRWDGCAQLRIDPKTKQVVGRALRQPPRKRRKYGAKRFERPMRFAGYQKQPDETSMFVPGSEVAHKIVIDIFRMFHIQDTGVHRIVKHLRTTGVTSSFGCEWNIGGVYSIFRNPIYIGKEVRHRWTKALYHKLGADGPIPVHVDQDQLQAEKRTSIPATERPRNEWQLVDKPNLKDFLPPDVRGLAISYIMKLHDEDVITAKQAERRRKTKHEDNSYVLSHIVRSKQTGETMRGDTTTKKRGDGRVSRRYYFDGSTAAKAITGIPARRVPAGPLEEAVVSAIFNVLNDRAWVESRVRSFVANMDNNTIDTASKRSALLSEREEINRRLKRIHKTSNDLSDEELESLVTEDNARIVAIRHELAELDRRKADQPPTIDEAIVAVNQRLSVLPQDWHAIPHKEMKRLLRSVIDNLVIDLATREVELTMRLPEGYISLPIPVPAGGEDKVRVNFRSAWLSEVDATCRSPIPIDKIGCQQEAKAKCYACRRTRIAA